MNTLVEVFEADVVEKEKVVSGLYKQIHELRSAHVVLGNDSIERMHSISRQDYDSKMRQLHHELHSATHTFHEALKKWSEVKN